MRTLNFSGAPALLLPVSVLPSWHGILHTDRPDADATPDFTSADGVDWYVWDAFDFDHPKTDYDRLCAKLENADGARVHEIGGRHALVVSDGSDAFAWWPEARAIVSNAIELPRIETLDALEWTLHGTFELAEPDCVLMNSALHGDETKEGNESELERVRLEVGRYRFESARGESVGVYRLVAT